MESVSRKGMSLITVYNLPFAFRRPDAGVRRPARPGSPCGAGARSAHRPPDRGRCGCRLPLPRVDAETARLMPAMRATVQHRKSPRPELPVPLYTQSVTLHQ